jgi:hypothetical protein
MTARQTEPNLKSDRKIARQIFQRKQEQTLDNIETQSDSKTLQTLQMAAR